MTTSIASSAAPLGTPAAHSLLFASAAKVLTERNAGIKSIDAQLSRDGARLSGLGKLMSALDQFRSRALKLANGKLDMGIVADGQAVKAQLVGDAAAAGTHTVEVSQLAQGQQIATQPLVDKEKAVGGGPALIRIDIGGGSSARSATLRIEGGSSLEDIAGQMRGAGLDARVVQDGKGYALRLTGPAGAANTMRIGVSGDPALRGLLSFEAGVKGSATQTAAARDAVFSIDRRALTLPSNTLDAALPGMTPTLTAAGKSELKIVQDPAAAAARVKDFVGAYNALNMGLEQLKEGDTLDRAVVERIRIDVRNVLAGAAMPALAEAGITRRNGALIVDDAKLKAAAGSDPGKLAALFGKAGAGLADQFAAQAGKQLAAGGVLDKEASAVRDHVKTLSTRRSQAVSVMQQQAAALARQYALIGAGSGSSFDGARAAGRLSAFDFMP